MEMTLREVCDTLKVSRRAVQGYEKAGLVCASGKNRYGYLIYDEHAQERIRQIKLFQQLGFTLKEMSFECQILKLVTIKNTLHMVKIRVK